MQTLNVLKARGFMRSAICRWSYSRDGFFAPRSAVRTPPPTSYHTELAHKSDSSYYKELAQSPLIKNSYCKEKL